MLAIKKSPAPDGVMEYFFTYSPNTPHKFPVLPGDDFARNPSLAGCEHSGRAPCPCGRPGGGGCGPGGLRTRTWPPTSVLLCLSSGLPSLGSVFSILIYYLRSILQP